MREKYMNYLKDLVRVFEDTLEISRKYFKIPSSKKYEVKKIKIIWSEDTVKSIFELSGKIAALNFADDTIPGGLVWQGAETQEECLCRCSNLYDSLKDEYYPNDGVIYSRDVVFFRNEKYEFVKPKKVDVISCAAIGTDDEIKEKMKMILAIAKVNEVDNLILGKWGCGAYGRDWEKMKEMWVDCLR